MVSTNQLPSTCGVDRMLQKISLFLAIGGNVITPSKSIGLSPEEGWIIETILKEGPFEETLFLVIQFFSNRWR